MESGDRMVGEGENGGYGEGGKERVKFKSNVSFEYSNFVY